MKECEKRLMQEKKTQYHQRLKEISSLLGIKKKYFSFKNFIFKIFGVCSDSGDLNSELEFENCLMKRITEMRNNVFHVLKENRKLKYWAKYKKKKKGKRSSKISPKKIEEEIQPLAQQKTLKRNMSVQSEIDDIKYLLLRLKS